MRAAFYSAAFKEKTEAFGKAVADVAAGRAEDSAVTAFWQEDKKPEELRAALLRGAFKAACRNGAGASAHYLLAQYPEHLNITEIKNAAVAAIAEGHDPLALDLAKKIMAAADRKNGGRALDIICAEAFEKGGADLTKELLRLLPRTDSTYLYRTALGQKPDNLKQVVKHCYRQKTLAQKDLDQTLVIAVKNKDMPMAQELLQFGADVDGCRKATLRRIAEWAGDDDATAEKFLSVLINAGADPYLAQNIFPAAYGSRIQDMAEKTQQRHVENLQEVVGDKMTMQNLRATVMPDGQSGLHYAAKHRLLGRVPFDGMTVDDLQSTGADGQTLVQAVEKSGALPSLLQPAKWQGQKDVLQHFVAGLSDDAREKIDLAVLLHDVDMLTLRGRARGLSLKPKGF